MAKVLLRKTAPNSNPEYTTITLDGTDDEIQNQIDVLINSPDFHPGWASRGEPDYWGKDAGIEIVEIVRD